MVKMAERSERNVRSRCSVFDDHTFSPRKVERPVGSGPIADEEREPRVAGTALPFAIRPMEAWGPGGGRDQELCPLGLSTLGNPRRIGIRTNQNAHTAKGLSGDGGDPVPRARPGFVADPEGVDLPVGAEDGAVGRNDKHGVVKCCRLRVLFGMGQKDGHVQSCDQLAEVFHPRVWWWHNPVGADLRRQRRSRRYRVQA